MRLLLLVLSVLACAVGVTAGPARAADASTPVLRISDGDLVWNDVALGTSADKTLTVVNAGGGTLPVAAPAVGGGDSADFSVVSTTCTGARLAAGQTCAVTVRFAPRARSTRVSHLRLGTGIAGCTSWATLAGSGAPTTSAGHPDRHSGFSTVCDGAVASAPTQTTVVINQLPGTVSNGGVLGVSESGSPPICRSKRKLRIHVKAGRGKAFKRGSVSITTKGRTFSPKRIGKGRRAGQYYADLSFNGLKVGRYAVKVKAKLTNGRSFARTRHFVTCISGKTPTG